MQGTMDQSHIQMIMTEELHMMSQPSQQQIPLVLPCSALYTSSLTLQWQ